MTDDRPQDMPVAPAYGAPPPALVGAPAPQGRGIGRGPKIAMALALVVGGVAAGRGLVIGSARAPWRTSPDGLAPGRLESRIVDEQGEWVQVSTVLDHPRDVVWALITDHVAFGASMPSRGKVEVLPERGAKGQARLHLTFDYTAFQRETWIELEEDRTGPSWTLSWTQVRGQFAQNHGRWRLDPAGEGKTFVRYELLCDPDLPAPRWAVLATLRDGLPAIVKGVRRALDAKAGR